MLGEKALQGPCFDPVLRPRVPSMDPSKCAPPSIAIADTSQRKTKVRDNLHPPQDNPKSQSHHRLQSHKSNKRKPRENQYAIDGRHLPITPNQKAQNGNRHNRRRRHCGLLRARTRTPIPPPDNPHPPVFHASDPHNPRRRRPPLQNDVFQSQHPLRAQIPTSQALPAPDPRRAAHQGAASFRSQSPRAVSARGRPRPRCVRAECRGRVDRGGVD